MSYSVNRDTLKLLNSKFKDDALGLCINEDVMFPIDSSKFTVEGGEWSIGASYKGSISLFDRKTGIMAWYDIIDGEFALDHREDVNTGDHIFKKEKNTDGKN